jgi:hypothetical protein
MTPDVQTIERLTRERDEAMKELEAERHTFLMENQRATELIDALKAKMAKVEAWAEDMGDCKLLCDGKLRSILSPSVKNGMEEAER